MALFLSPVKVYFHYCWKFHDQLWLVNEKATSDKRKGPRCTEGGTILDML